MKRFAVAFAALSLILSGFAPIHSQHVVAQQGNSYTSDDYTITWDDNLWFVVSTDDVENGTDLVLSNGVSYVSFAHDSTITDHRQCVNLFDDGIRGQDGVTDVQPILDANGDEVRLVEDDRAYVGVSFTVTQEDQTAEFAERFECRPLVPGESILIIDLIVIPATEFDSEVDGVESLLTGLTIQDTTGPASPPASTETPPTAAATETPTPEPTTTPDLAVQAAESIPVFAANGWRVSVVAALRSPGVNAIGLARRDERDWLVVVADITNWTEADANLTLRDIRIRFPESDTLVRAAPNSSKAAAEAVGVTMTDVTIDQAFRANQTRRAILVYSVNETFTDPTIVFGTDLPIAGLLDQDVNFDELPDVQRPPELQLAEVDRIRDGNSLDLYFPEEGDNRTISLAGIAAPGDGDCFGDEAADGLSALTGPTVFLESSADDTAYVWALDDNGNRILVNHDMVAGGFAIAAETTPSRFSTWIVAAQTSAQEAGTGIWTSCADDLPQVAEPTATPTALPTATTEPTPEPTIEPTEEPTEEPTGEPEVTLEPTATEEIELLTPTASEEPSATSVATTSEPSAAMFRGGPEHTGVQPGPGLSAPAHIPWEFQTSSTIFSSPAIVDGVIYAGSLDGSVYALNSSSGPAVWQFTTGDGILSSPAVANGVVYIGSEDMNLYAIDAATGRERWRFATGAAVSSSPAVVDGVVYVGSIDTYLYAIDANTGNEVWKTRVGPAFSSPAIVDGVVYIGAAQAVFALDAKTGEEIWRTQTGGSVQSSPAVSGDLVVVGNDSGVLTAVNRADGSEVWTFEAGDAILSSPAIADGRVFIGSNDQNLYAIDLEDGTEMWRFETGDTVTSSPAVADGVVYIGSYDGYIYGLDEETGEERWRYQAGPILSSPVVVGDIVYFGSGDGRLLARRPFNALGI